MPMQLREDEVSGKKMSVWIEKGDEKRDEKERKMKSVN